MISVFVPGLPVAQPRQRQRVVFSGGKAIATNYTPKKDPVNAFKATIKLVVSQRLETPMAGAVRLRMDFFFPRPASLTKKKKPNPLLRKTTKPDWDNLGKAVSDALNGIAWVDDAQISEVLLTKYICGDDEKPGVYIEIGGL